MYRISSPKTADVTCQHCHTLHRGVEIEYDEDGGYVDLDTTHCNEDYCTVKLCHSCEQFECDACGLDFCAEHKVQYADLALCVACMAGIVADTEVVAQEAAEVLA